MASPTSYQFKPIPVSLLAVKHDTIEQQNFCRRSGVWDEVSGFFNTSEISQTTHCGTPVPSGVDITLICKDCFQRMKPKWAESDRFGAANRHSIEGEKVVNAREKQYLNALEPLELKLLNELPAQSPIETVLQMMESDSEAEIYDEEEVYNESSYDEAFSFDADLSKAQSRNNMATDEEDDIKADREVARLVRGSFLSKFKIVVALALLGFIIWFIDNHRN